MVIRNRIKELRRVKASDLRPNPRNWRQHPDSQRTALQGVLAEVGYAAACIARELEDGSLELIDGHLRADLDPDEELPVLVLDVDAAEAAKLLVVLDPMTAMAEASEEALGTLLAEIETESEGLQAMLEGMADEYGLDVFESGNGEIEEVPPQIDRATELQEKWGTELGQLWVIPSKTVEGGEHRVLCGDSTKAEDVERVMGGEKAEMMFTDPPYGVDYEGGHFHSGDVKIKRTRPRLAADGSADIYRAFLPHALGVVDGPCYMWFAGSRGAEVYPVVSGAGCQIHALIIWHKINATYAAMNAQYKQRHEPCLYFKPKGSTLRWVGPTDECTVWEIKRDAINDMHPTQKPVELPARAIRNHDAKTVLDLFMGAGSTMVAAEQLGRLCYGLEIEPKYVAVILERMKDLGLTPGLER